MGRQRGDLVSRPLEMAWRDLEPGAAVELGGKRYVVEKLKVKGKVVKVTVAGHGGSFTREVKAKALVAIHRSRPAPERKPKTGAAADEQRKTLHDERGAQQRWATEAEGAKWNKPAGKAERVVAEVMPGANLVGVVRDEGTGVWYVPYLDASTVSAHLLIFHNLSPETTNYAELKALHDDLHERARVEPFVALHVDHEHRKTRP